MQNPDEIWQTEVNGEIYDATLDELTQWITEKSLSETDKVKRGNLRWLEAGKVPHLRSFFQAESSVAESIPLEETLKSTESKPCTIHPQQSSKFFCETCSHNFCESCPQGKSCPYCGAICQELN